MSTVIAATVRAARNSAVARNAAGLAALLLAAESYRAHASFAGWYLQLLALLATAMYTAANAPGNLDHVRPSSLSRRDRETWEEVRRTYLTPAANLRRNWLFVAGWSVLCIIALERTL